MFKHGMQRWLLTATLLLAMAPAAAAGEPLPFIKGTYAEILKAQTGRPTIVHIWGLSCGPCLVELPEWGRLAAEHPEIEIILINADRPGLQSGKRIAATLDKAGLAGTRSYVFADRFEDRLRFEIDAEWQGELPRTILIGRDGKTTAMTGVADMAGVRSWIGAAAK